MKIAKERVIYDNYDLSEIYPDDVLKEEAIDCEWVDEDEEITDDMLWQWRYDASERDWDDVKYELKKFFKDKEVAFIGNVGRWDGVYKAKAIGEFFDLFYKAITDCDYIKLYDENGHFYLTCTHHDGTCHFEIKEVVKDKSYMRLPRFMEKVWGCKPREYEESNKEILVRKFNNQARSFYS